MIHTEESLHMHSKDVRKSKKLRDSASYFTQGFPAALGIGIPGDHVETKNESVFKQQHNHFVILRISCFVKSKSLFSDIGYGQCNDDIDDR